MSESWRGGGGGGGGGRSWYNRKTNTTDSYSFQQGIISQSIWSECTSAYSKEGSQFTE